MSYVRQDSALWYNLAGVVAAYQPVRAPGPLMARYNQARGGENKYRAEEPTGLPTWSAAIGWKFNNTAPIKHYTTSLIVSSGWSMFVRFSGESAADVGVLAGSFDGAALRFYVAGAYSGISGKNLYANGGIKFDGSSSLSGVIGIAGQQGYLNGVADGTALNAWNGTNTRTFYIGCLNQSGTATDATNGYIQSLAVYARVLSKYEILSVSRQMQYCDVNPDWSAWGRRRQWFYLAATASGVPKHADYYARLRNG